MKFSKICEPTDRRTENAFSFFVLYEYRAGSKKAFLREEGGTRQGFPEANEMSFGGSLRSVTEGARVTLDLY